MLLTDEVIKSRPVFLVYSNISGCNISKYIEQLRTVLSSRSDTDIKIVHIDQLSSHSIPEDSASIVWSDSPIDKNSITIGSQRSVIEIVLTCTPLTGSLRSMVNIGVSVAAIMMGEHTDEMMSYLADQYTQLEAYENFKNGKPDTRDIIEIDTTRFTVHEIQGFLGLEPTPNSKNLNDNIQPETIALNETIASLNDVLTKLRYKVFYQNIEAFEYNLQTLRRLVDLLNNTYAAEALIGLRQDIKACVIDCWYGLTPMVMPRFANDANGILVADNTSKDWTPQHYKLCAALPLMKSLLKNKTIVDPFAGAGIMINYFAAFDCIEGATASDIAYSGGKTFVDDMTYNPRLNNEMLRFAFDNLPSWCKPNPDKITDFVAADAKSLPFADSQFDYVVTDPPYGISFNENIDTFLDALPELLRVSTIGVIALVPISWYEKIDTTLYEIDILTGELCKGNPTVQTQYLLITNK